MAKEVSVEYIDKARHSLAHVLARAVSELFDDVVLGIGPNVDNGMYYDFQLPHALTEADFGAIEARMSEIIKSDTDFVFEEISDYAEYFKNEPYKLELAQEYANAGDVITAYSLGSFTDMCAGPHVANTRELRNWGFKIASIAGAYWRGDSGRPMLQRVYVHAFASTKELKAYHKFLEEAKKRDHRLLGVQHDLFDLYPEGPGFPFFFPKGMVLRNLIEAFWRKTHTRFGYSEIKTPIILNQDLWHKSGHWEHYRDNMYTTTIDEADFAVKPMNCPGAMLVYKRKMHSYRDLPQRMGELGLVHRHELSGTLHGLMRVRCFTQDDAHIFMMPEQIKDEVKNAITMFKYVYGVFGFSNIRVELSTRPENSMGKDEDWEVATKALNDVLDELEMDYVINPGDGAFYGPKIDFHLADCIGRTWQCGTIQLDFQMPERFNLSFTGADNAKHRPIMVHHTTLGSIERFMGIITEHFAARFPLWLSPVQIGIVPVHDEHNSYADEVYNKLVDNGFRAHVDKSNGTMGNKIKSYRNELTPYVLILGDKEKSEGTISLRNRDGKQVNDIELESFIKDCKENIVKHATEL